MRVELVEEWVSGLPADDAHPYRTGPWQPNVREYDAFDLDVVGELPRELAGVYLRNTENPLHDSIGRYHPFDGDGMLHALTVADGRAEYHNRFVRTAGLEAECAAGAPLWAGLMESPRKSLRAGWGARTGLKDASSTDVVVHRGRAISSFYQCGELYESDPRTLAPLGRCAWTGGLTPGWGVSAHTKVDEATGELLFFNYSKEAPYMHYGVVDAQGRLVHYVPVPLPGPRLPHDMAFTEHYAILCDFPLFWDPEALKAGAHAVRFHRDMPSRFAVIPRRGTPQEIRWFEAEPTFVLHFTNAYEDGRSIVLDGFFEANPDPELRPDPAEPRSLFRMLDMHVIGARPHRWRLDLDSGAVTEAPLHDGVLEFGMIDPRRAGRPYRYTWAMTTKPGWFLFDGLVRLDVERGETQRFAFPEGVYCSEAPMAPRPGGSAEDDGWVLTYVTDMNRDASEVWVFDAAEVARGPVARVALPERICVGTHSCWAPA
ncbi:MAG: carotenoid oxygenase family protein [Pseudomonadales bacterium]|jgi:carotenoid cleavage dioxygenase|nr:carotenoid oxygenase family protein [Pseudomonadales bacterium]